MKGLHELLEQQIKHSIDISWRLKRVLPNGSVSKYNVVSLNTFRATTSNNQLLLLIPTNKLWDSFATEPHKSVIDQKLARSTTCTRGSNPIRDASGHPPSGPWPA